VEHTLIIYAFSFQIHEQLYVSYMNPINTMC